MKQRLLAGIAFVVLVLASGCTRQGPLQEPSDEGKPVSQWIAALKDKDPQVREQAVTALEHLAADSPEAIHALVDYLGSGAKEEVGKCGGRYYFPPKSAVKALTRIGRPALPALREALWHHDPVIRAGAAAIQNMGDIGKDALSEFRAHQTLERALADSKYGVFVPSED
jgi:HEAT repeat protein